MAVETAYPGQSRNSIASQKSAAGAQGMRANTWLSYGVKSRQDFSDGDATGYGVCFWDWIAEAMAY